MEAIILGLLTSVPSILTAVNELIARGRQSGELSSEQADALTAKGKAIFAQYSQPARPPVGSR